MGEYQCLFDLYAQLDYYYSSSSSSSSYYYYYYIIINKVKILVTLSRRQRCRGTLHN